MSTKTHSLQAVGEYFHIYNRGVNRNHIFLEERNYEYFVRRMKTYLNPEKMALIVYCLMPNHFHLIVRQDEPYALSNFMKGVCDGYAKAINKRFKRSGHLFQGKYKIKHIDDPSYLLHLSRYIHLNPVAARLTQCPEGWKYSSYQEYCGMREASIVECDVILSRFKDRAGYVQFVRDYKPGDREKVQKFLFVRREQEDLHLTMRA